MLKNITNNQTIDALSPWTTKDNEELVPLFPSIMNKKKKKKQKNPKDQKQNMKQPQKSNDLKKTKSYLNPMFLSKDLSHITNEELVDDINNKSSAFQQIPQRNSQIIFQSIKKQQNEFNFIRKSKKIKQQPKQKQNSLRSCLKPLSNQKKCIQFSNYELLQDTFQTKQQNILKEIQNNQKLNTQRKMCDIHSLYLIEKLRSISNTNVTVKENKIKYSQTKNHPNAFLEYLSNQNSYRQKQRKIFTQRDLFHVKTECAQSSEKYNLRNVKRTIQNIPYTQQKQKDKHFNLMANQFDKKLSKFDQEGFVIESTFTEPNNLFSNLNIDINQSDKKSDLLHFSQPKSVQLKLNSSVKNVIKQQKQNQFQDKFARVNLISYHSQKLQEKKTQEQLKEVRTNLSQVKNKISFSIQKSKLQAKKEIKSINSKQGKQQNSLVQTQTGMRIDKQIKKNLRKLRGYLVKKTRDNCVQGEINQNEVYIHEKHLNYLPNE